MRKYYMDLGFARVVAITLLIICAAILEASNHTRCSQILLPKNARNIFEIERQGSISLDPISDRAIDTAANITLLPIIFLHGIDGHASEFDAIMEWIRAEYGPNAPIMHSLAIGEGRESLFRPMMEQRDRMVDYLTSNAQQLGIDKGFHFVAHSQGALLARSVIQKLPPSLQVKTYISLSGPQRGQWGPCNMDVPDLAHDMYGRMARSVGWWAFYNSLAQDRLSFAGYWNDPRHLSRFQQECQFLPVVNGYNAPEFDDDMGKQRANFLRLERAIFLGSAQDECINPPLSSVFSFLDENSNVSGFNQSWEYQSDAFGLRSMHQQGRLVLEQVSNVKHMDWLNATIFEQYVLPHLLQQAE